MRLFWTATFLSLALMSAPPGAGASEGGERERAFVSALAAFDAARTQSQFRSVSVAFESLISPDYQNDALYYNIGNARVKAGDYGRAIMAYRKAKMYRPRDPWLDANLNQALNAAPGRIPPAPEPWWRNVFFWSGWLSFPEKFNLALAVWMASIAALAAGTYLRKRRVTLAGAALVATAVLFSIDAFAAQHELLASNRAVVVAETIAQKSPGQNGDAAFDQPLRDGAEFTIIERRGDSVFGHFHGIGDAWLPAKNIAE